MEWLPIESIPTDGREVIVHDDQFLVPVFAINAYKHVVDGFGVTSNSYDPTHWMPLPPPPKRA